MWFMFWILISTLLKFVTSSSTEYTSNVWVKDKSDFTMIIDMNQARGIEEHVRLRFQREGSAHVIDVLSLVFSDLSSHLNEQYADRVIAKRNLGIRKVNVTLLNSNPRDAGLYFCEQAETVFEKCGHRLHVLDLPEIVTNLHRDVTMTFDITRASDDETSVMIKHRPENVDLWREMLKVTITGSSLMANSIFEYPREVQFRMSIARRGLDVVLSKVALSDAGFYGCFSGTSQAYITKCGNQLIVRDYAQVVSTLHGKVNMTFDISKTATLEPSVAIMYRPEDDDQWREILIVLKENLYVSRNSMFSRELQHSVRRSSGTLEVTLTNVQMTDSGYFGCFSTLSKTYLPECGYRLIVEDLPKHMATLHKDITMTFDLSPVDNVEPSVLIMFRSVDDDRWREVLSIARETMKVSSNSLFHRHVQHGPGRSRSAVDVTLFNVLLPDAGFYSCFSGTTETYIPHCGYQLIVEDLREISAFEEMNAMMIFSLVLASVPWDSSLAVKFKRQKSDAFVDVATIGQGSVMTRVAGNYQERVEIMPTGQKGVMVVTLMHVTLQDAGDYRCFVGTSDVYTPECGFRLTVHVEESKDINQVNTIEHHDVNLTFEIAPLKPATTQVTIKFQHKSCDQKDTIVMTVDPFNLSVSLMPDYSKRLIWQSVRPDRLVHARLTKVTVLDDGAYMCFHGDSASVVPKCGQKLNVFVPDIQRVVTKPWNVFETDAFTATCDAHRLVFPSDIVSVVELTLKKRNVLETEFSTVATYTPHSEPQTDFRKPSDKNWLIDTRGEGDPKRVTLQVTFLEATAGESGEYECTSNASSEAGSFLFHSLISLVTVKSHGQVAESETPTETEEKAEDYLDIHAYENGDVTFTFNLSKAADVTKVTIKSRGQSEAEWKDLLEVEMADFKVKSLAAESELIFFSSNKEEKTVDLTVHKLSMSMAGVYRSFTDKNSKIVAECGYRLTVTAHVTTTAATVQPDEAPTTEIRRATTAPRRKKTTKRSRGPTRRQPTETTTPAKESGGSDEETTMSNETTTLETTTTSKCFTLDSDTHVLYVCFVFACVSIATT